jgi:hypothetical protein
MTRYVFRSRFFYDAMQLHNDLNARGRMMA